MYRKKDRETGYLFSGLFPFGGKLREDNRWLKIAELIPWDELEREYAKHFSEGMGRPALDARLVIGALLLQYVRRNLKQLDGLVEEVKRRGHEIERKVIERLQVSA